MEEEILTSCHSVYSENDSNSRREGRSVESMQSGVKAAAGDVDLQCGGQFHRINDTDTVRLHVDVNAAVL